MKKITFLIVVSFCIFQIHAQKPNIVFVMVDDLGYGDLGYTGATDIPTPNIDALANGGIKLTSAYSVHPFCGPSRMGFITGRYPHKFGAQYNLADNSSINLGIPTNERMMSNMLQDAGYRTGLVGKWHLGDESQYHPNNRGFDDFYGFLYGGHRYFPSQYKAAYNGPNSWVYNHPLQRNGVTVTDDDEYITDELTNEGIRFINEAASSNKPFFLFMSYNAPHSPLEAKTEDMNVDVIKDISNADRRKYAAMVYAVDRGMKRLVDALKQQNIYNNTLIVFTSDNGGSFRFAANNGPLSGQKGDTLEGGFRVPTFFHWPNTVPAGIDYDYPVSALDFYPTFAHLAGATIQQNKELDGLNVWNAVVNNTNSRPNNEVIMSIRHDNASNRVGIRRGDWKAYRFNNTQDWRLFNLKNDIGEQNDLSSTNTGLLQELKLAGATIAKTFVEPLWFHASSAETNWNNNNMPNFEATFGSALSVDDESTFANSLISFYPNPIKNSIHFTIEDSNVSNIDVTIYNVQGVKVYQNSKLERNQKNQFMLNLDSKIARGIYLIKVSYEQLSISKKIIVQ